MKKINKMSIGSHDILDQNILLDQDYGNFSCRVSMNSAKKNLYKTSKENKKSLLFRCTKLAKLKLFHYDDFPIFHYHSLKLEIVVSKSFELSKNMKGTWQGQESICRPVSKL